MKKIILFLLVITVLKLEAQTDVIVPVNRISYVANDTGSNASLFNFNPSILELRVIGGQGANLGFYYQITDTICENLTHVLLGSPFTRSCTITGNVSIPMVYYQQFYDLSQTPPVPNQPLMNYVLSGMDLIIDTTRQFIFR